MHAHWHVPSTGWPATTSDEKLTSDQVLGVLDQFDEYYPAAMASLAETETPPHASATHSARAGGRDG